MSAAYAARGKQAFDARDYDKAVKEYTAAIKESPTSPDYFIQRATAYTRLQKHAEALEDAEQGVINAQQRAKKESIIEAQFRRGVALYQLGRFGDADFVLKIVKDLQKDHKQADMWINKTTVSLKKIPQDDPAAQCTVKATPSPSPKHENNSSSSEQAESAAASADKTTSSSTSTVTTTVPSQTPADKIRYDWYQNTENIYFTLLAKGVPKRTAQIDINDRSLNISFPLTTGSSYDLTLDPLFAPVIPDKCVTRVMPSKIEIILIKATVGQKWTALEGKDVTEASAAGGTEKPKDDPVKLALLSDNSNKAIAPAYPTSSKSGPKDWDKVVKDLGKNEGDSDKSLDDDDDDDVGGDEANHFFKKLFKGASPEAQRAMMKSYTESNGTALSTDWEEVSKGKVETVPPDGMEAKEWEK